jgi:hypothetical protein
MASEIPPLPLQEDGLQLEAPLRLATAKIACWKCKKQTSVVAIVAASVEEIEDGQSCGNTDGSSYVYNILDDDMPEVLARRLQEVAPYYAPIYSGTMNETTWANKCENCGALQGAFYQHMEPDGPFFGGPENFAGEYIELLGQSVRIESASFTA